MKILRQIYGLFNFSSRLLGQDQDAQDTLSGSVSSKRDPKSTVVNVRTRFSFFPQINRASRRVVRSTVWCWFASTSKFRFIAWPLFSKPSCCRLAPQRVAAMPAQPSTQYERVRLYVFQYKIENLLFKHPKTDILVDWTMAILAALTPFRYRNKHADLFI